ncbi:MAG: SDR family NAD(P)-dependent oxidoreductase [Alphaproteobacteria bacterium]
MVKTILITGASDGLGFATAKILADLGQNVILHARDEQKLNLALKDLGLKNGYICDLSTMQNVRYFAEKIKNDKIKIDVLINNAGVFKVADTRTIDGLDIRFAVNTIAPYILTDQLLPILSDGARIINLASAAQTTVDINALMGKTNLPADSTYAMSKLALIMVTNYFANKYPDKVFVSINPKSFLGTKMVKDAYGMQGVDVNIGARILTEAALDKTFANSSGKYFDNDSVRFANPHPDAFNEAKSAEVIKTIQQIIGQ